MCRNQCCAKVGCKSDFISGALTVLFAEEIHGVALAVRGSSGVSDPSRRGEEVNRVSKASRTIGENIVLVVSVCNLFLVDMYRMALSVEA